MTRLRFSFILSPSPSPHSVGGWRLPRSYRGFRWDSADYWEHLARTLERGKVDMAFFADSNQVYGESAEEIDQGIRYGVVAPRLDPAPFIPVMARVTRGLGFGITSSTSYIPPYYFARKMSTLDHISEGRAGWNVVASFGVNEARSFGQNGQREHGDRYAQAEEYVGLCQRFWDSWAEDALLEDRASGLYADPAKVQKFSHEGEYFRTAGPLCAHRMPQGRPVILQAGASAEGMAFAARHAEATFAARGSVAGMRQYASALAQAREPGNTREPIIFWNAVVFVAESAQEAKRKMGEVVDGVPLEAGLSVLGGMLGLDLTRRSPTAPISSIDPAEVRGIKGLLTALLSDFGADLTIGEAARLHGAGLTGMQFCGTPDQVADAMEETIAQGGGHGFMMRPTGHPSSAEDFVNLVVPVLQARGRVWRDYPHRHFRTNLLHEGVD